jgi:hypothetical protein
MGEAEGRKIVAARMLGFDPRRDHHIGIGLAGCGNGCEGLVAQGLRS